MHNLIVTEPVYQQMLRMCREQIASGTFKADERFPSERDLARDYRISRATANKVISSLIAENLLFLRPGIGTFVSPQRGLHASLIEMESFTAHAETHGHKPATNVLRFEQIAAEDLPPHIVAEMNPETGESFIYVERLRSADSEPVILEHRWIRASLVPGLRSPDLQGSFYDLLRTRFRLPLEGERHHISARNLSAPEASKLQVKRGAAALVVEGPGFTTSGTPLWYQVLLYRGDRYHLENVVGNRSQPNTTQFKLSPA